MTTRDFVSWAWPPPAIARRLWPAVFGSTAYTALVLWVFPEHPTVSLGWLNVFGVINGIVLGALVGFRTKAAYDRWWEARILWGQLVNHSRNLCLKAVVLAAPDEAERRELARLVCGFPAALMRHLRGPVQLQQVPGFEKETATPTHVPMDIARRVFDLLAGWRRAGRIDGHAQQMLDPHAVALMDVCGACERVRNTPLPGSYLSLLRHGLLLSFLLLPWHMSHALGAWSLAVQGVVVYFLFGVELTAEELEEPFGYDGDDLPLERYVANICAGAGEVLGV
jgi:putative membrane protein